MKRRDKDAIYDPNVDYDSLEQHSYRKFPGHIFYVCPKCGREYLATFIIEENGETMCVDCANS